MKGSMLLMILIVAILSRAYCQTGRPVDKSATTETINLFRNLKKIAARGYLVGHQDALAYGVNWKYQKGRSDIKDVTGDYPALYGWELGHLELDSALNLDSVPFAKIRDYIKEGYERGGVITISWHGTNPMTGKTAWDPAEGTVAAILPGGKSHDAFKAQLDKIASFLLSLQDKHGKYIPVLFRPFHELTGGWFWWGTKYTSVGEYKELFRFTVDYLQKEKGLHHLLYVYNTGGGFKSEDEFLERYPGDDVVDVVSFDTYQFKSRQNGFTETLSQNLSVIEKVAKIKDKAAAIAEMGFSQIPDAAWWTGTVASALKGHRFSYLLFWRNAGYKSDKTTEFYVPYPGQPSEKDFLRFYRLPETLFEKDAKKAKLYQ